jgi:hypothetical protein
MDKDLIIENLAIRDTADHNSDVSDMGEFNAETLIVLNGLNQSVDVQLQGSIDATTWLDVGNPFSVGITTNDYATVTDYFPCYRVVASCETAPTTGNLDIWIVKSK